MGIIRRLIGLGILLAFIPAMLYGQVLSLQFRHTSLEEALEQLAEQTGIRLIYAHRLVVGRTTTCTYQGSRVEEALQCVLEASGLYFRQLRANQYVLFASDDTAPSSGILTGIVLAADGHEALTGAHVYLPNAKRGTSTNTAGFFSLVLPSTRPQRVIISHLGYEPLDTLVQPGTSPSTFFLQPRVYVNPEVIVRDHNGDRHTLPGMERIPALLWKNFPPLLGEPDLFRALERVPGIQRQGELGGEITIRGAAPDQVLYLMDGVPIYYPYHTFGLFSIFQTEILRNVTLYRGVFPAAYGGRLGAIVSADTRDGRQEKPEVSIGLSPVSLRGSALSPIGKKGGFLFAARRSYIDWLLRRRLPFQTPRSSREPLDIGYYLYDATLHLSYHFRPTHQIRLSLYQGGDRLWAHGPFQALEASLSPLLGLQFFHHWGNRFIQLQHRFVLPSSLYWHSSLYYVGYTGIEDIYMRPALTATVNSRYEVHVQDLTLRTGFQWPSGKLHSMESGLQITYRRFKSFLQDTLTLAPGVMDTLYQQVRQEALESAWYFQDRLTLPRQLTLTGGLRITHFSSGNYVRISPRLALRIPFLADRATVILGLNRSHQFLHRLRDRYAYIYDVTSTRWLPVTSRILPASATELSLRTEFTLFSPLSITLEGFYRKARNVLIPRDIYQRKDQLLGPGIATGTLLQQYTPGDNRAYGTELSVDIRHPPFMFTSFYTFTRTLLKPANAPRYYPAPYDIAHTLQSNLSIHRERWQVAFLLLLRSGYPYHQPEGFYTLSPPSGKAPVYYFYLPEAYNARLPLYIRLDASFTYRFRWKASRWTLALQVYNLLNHRNVIGRRYYWEENRYRVQPVRGLPIIPVPTIEVHW